MKKQLIIITGLIIIMIGFLYDNIFVGIPSQNASITQIIQQIEQSKIADFIKRTGVVVFIIGLVLKLFSYLSKIYHK